MSENFKDYYGKEIHLIIDGRGFGKEVSVSLELKACVVDETERMLNLENVCFLEHYSCNGGEYVRESHAFVKSSINKDYIIGIFERDKTEE